MAARKVAPGRSGNTSGVFASNACRSPALIPTRCRQRRTFNTSATLESELCRPMHGSPRQPWRSWQRVVPAFVHGLGHSAAFRESRPLACRRCVLVPGPLLCQPSSFHGSGLARELSERPEEMEHQLAALSRGVDALGHRTERPPGLQVSHGVDQVTQGAAKPV